ncbi:uncharacterized protein LOC125611447 [Marmota marmota marmota]|uniref:uncharacterized protein LOC125611447 n=1 Tax=Marmota marmota marmota TaxID=9994 RepID=UPI002093BB23|nr:uncharacterized protein LOC125611447 [Marmota marmota marmota]
MGPGLVKHLWAPFQSISLCVTTKQNPGRSDVDPVEGRELQDLGTGLLWRLGAFVVHPHDTMERDMDSHLRSEGGDGSEPSSVSPNQGSCWQDLDLPGEEIQAVLAESVHLCIGHGRWQQPAPQVAFGTILCEKGTQGGDKRSSLAVSRLVDSFTSLVRQELEKDLVNVLQRGHSSWLEGLLCRRPKVLSIQKVLELLSQKYEDQQQCMEEVFLPGQMAFCSTVQMWLYLYPEDFVGSMASLRSLRTFLLHTMPESGLTVQVESLLTGLENTDPTASPGKTLN